jgi:hypothetical protein
MPKPELWSKVKGRKEFFVPIPRENEYESRIRVRFTKQGKGKSKKKEIDLFQIGLEINYQDKWDSIIRYCNYHKKEENEYHIHNKYHFKLINLDNNCKKYIRKLNNKKTSASVYRWCLREMKTYYKYYLKNFLKKSSSL